MVAVFDLDGTLTRRDTLFPFLRFVGGTRAFLLRLPLVLPLLAAMALGLLSRRRAKERVLGLFLRGVPREELRLRGEAFARERLPALLRPQAKARLAWHRSEGHRCVLATASLAEYAEPWARAAGFEDVCASRLDYDGAGRATGRLAGENCRGAAKLARLEALLGELSRLELHGYGDSRADRAFLARCAEAHYRPFRRGERRNAPRDFVKLMRPHQWAKNAFVFVGVLFGHGWAAPQLLAHALLAAGAFCLAASAVYIVNDFADRERDRAHPRKRQRPLAAGSVTPGAAL
ncbi:MAG TPA: HAD-IB family hydrolase, partial [Burkholderiales bacterium]|nr:HAD-IB family hydrolase [Burkholderiales bacterium]